MKLSIITINYNNAAGLKKTLDSVAMQTYTDFEHIIVDGASTDCSVDVIREYEQSLAFNLSPLTSSLKWISESDTGVYNAMNKGIRMTKGEYLLFLNSGDFLINKTALEEVFFNDCEADILCARCNVSDNGKVVWTSDPPNKVTFGTLYTVGLAHQSTFIRKKLFDNIGYYDETFRYNADIEFWYRSIIDNHATTQRIDVITTDYNLDGISSKENKSELYLLEKERILAPYSSFCQDYDDMRMERMRLSSIAWVFNRPILMKLLSLYRKILKHI